MAVQMYPAVTASSKWTTKVNNSTFPAQTLRTGWFQKRFKCNPALHMRIVELHHKPFELKAIAIGRSRNI